MVEVPSVAARRCEHSCGEVDFVSVGTNDLVQYLLAVDRDNPWVARLYEPHHPAVMAALTQRGARARASRSKPCSVCGDVADDPATALMLLGMGFDAVSVAPNFCPEIKYAVRAHLVEREARELRSPRSTPQATVRRGARSSARELGIASDCDHAGGTTRVGPRIGDRN